VTKTAFRKADNTPIMLQIKDLKIDASYQRPDFVNNRVVNLIANKFDRLLAGVVTVGKRGDGSLWVVDGQHRVLGARKKGLDALASVVFQSSGPQHEAQVFYDLNKTRTGINCISIYKAMLVQGEQNTLRIQELLDQHGFAIGKKKGEFAAANAIRDSYESGVLGRVLSVIREAFGDGDAESWHWMYGSSHFIQMLTLIYKRKGSVVDDQRMALVLSRMGFKAYQKMASSLAGTTGNRAAKIAPVFIEEIYNKRFSKKIDWYGEQA